MKEYIVHELNEEHGTHLVEAFHNLVHLSSYWPTTASVDTLREELKRRGYVEVDVSRRTTYMGAIRLRGATPTTEHRPGKATVVAQDDAHATICAMCVCGDDRCGWTATVYNDQFYRNSDY